MSIEVHVSLIKNGIEGKGFNNGIDINCGITVIPDKKITGDNFEVVEVGLIPTTPGNGPHVVVSLDPVGFVVPLLVTPTKVTYQIIPYTANCDGLGFPDCYEAGNLEYGLSIKCIGTTKGYDPNAPNETPGLAECLAACDTRFPFDEDPCANDRCVQDCNTCDEAAQSGGDAGDGMGDCPEAIEDCFELAGDDGDPDAPNVPECYKICGCNQLCKEFCKDCMERCALITQAAERAACEERCDPDPEDECIHYFTCELAFAKQFLIDNEDGTVTNLGRDGILERAQDGTICGCTTDDCGVPRCCPCDEGWPEAHVRRTTLEEQIRKRECLEEAEESCNCLKEDAIDFQTNTIAPGETITPEDVKAFSSECLCPPPKEFDDPPNPFWVLDGPGTIDIETGEYTAPEDCNDCDGKAVIKLCCKFREGRQICSDPVTIQINAGGGAVTAAIYTRCHNHCGIGGCGCFSNPGILRCDGTKFFDTHSVSGGLNVCDSIDPINCADITEPGQCEPTTGPPGECPCCSCCSPICCKFRDVRTDAQREACCCPPELEL